MRTSSKLNYRAAVLLAACLGCALGAPLQQPTKRTGQEVEQCVAQMTREIQAADKPGKGFGIVFYGDSIIETLRGTDKCRPCTDPNFSSSRSSCAGAPQVLTKWFGKYRPGVFGLSMDQTANLQYRLMTGQMPQVNDPKVAVIHIGANDFTNCNWGTAVQSAKEAALAAELPGILKRIWSSVTLLRMNMPNTEIVILGVLPRGTGTGKGAKNAANNFGWPSHYTKATVALNAALRTYASQVKKVTFLDCGAVFIKGNRIDPALMADALHPTGAGWDKLAACMAPTVWRLAGY